MLAQKVSLNLYINGNTHTIYFNNIPLDSGDTLNTFATLFSKNCEKSLDKKTDKIYKKFDFIKDKDLKDFHKKFQHIGNFMLLPCADKHSNSINMSRFSLWKDYCDLYLREIKNYYEQPEKTNETFKNIIETDKNNKNYFNTFDSFKEFIEFNSLDAFLDKDKIKNLCKYGQPFWHWMPNRNDKEYKEFAEHYVETAEKIIENRSEQLIESIGV